MKCSLSESVLLLLFLSGSASGLGSVLIKHIEQIQNYFTWHDAQTFCRSSPDYTDLAIIYNQLDAESLYLQQYNAWINGQLTPDFYWIWPNGHYFYPWSGPKPDSGDECVYINYKNKRFYEADCEEYYFFICCTFEDYDYKYTFINQSKTWSDAQQYCNDMNNELAVISGFSQLYSAASERDFPVWTGLYRDGKTWKWSTGVSSYRNWAPIEPRNDGDCVAMYSDSKQMITQNCSTRYPFICFKDNLLLVKENKTWEEALEYCKAFKSPNRGPYQLVSVQPGEDYSYAMNRAMEAETEEVWAGLRFLAGNWFWVNGADMLLSKLPHCPRFGQYCGAFSKTYIESLEARDCLQKKNFLCYSQW